SLPVAVARRRPSIGRTEETDPHFFDAADEFRAWLERHHQDVGARWVGLYKQGSGRPSMTWTESVDQALFFGWTMECAGPWTPLPTWSASGPSRRPASGARRTSPDSTSFARTVSCTPQARRPSPLAERPWSLGTPTRTS